MLYQIVMSFLIMVGGVFFGTNFGIIWQIIAFLGFVLFMDSKYVKQKELGSIVPLIIGICFFMGVLLGDVSWVVQTGAFTAKDILNPFIVK